MSASKSSSSLVQKRFNWTLNYTTGSQIRYKIEIVKFVGFKKNKWKY
jgi:hypothetical protein